MLRANWLNERTLRLCIISALALKVLDGFITTFLYTRPFWIDEWRIIYNLKFRSVPQLWGQLDYLQQFPRLYLSLLKIFTAAADYSYWSLRLPSFIVGICAILMAWRVMRRVYRRGDWLQYLFVIIVVAALPFAKYFVQVKQYTMDIFMSLLAVWQLLEILGLNDLQPINRKRYLLLCASLLLAPFFSYTYAISIAPVYALLAVACWHSSEAKRKRWLLLWLPLILCALSIVVFYFLDVRQLFADTGMREYWRGNLAPNLDIRTLLMHFYWVFAEVGTGFVFKLLFGLLGMAAFLRACFVAAKDVRYGVPHTLAWIRLYSVVLLLIAAVLFLAGKLPLGESRLNAFLTTAIIVLIIDLLRFLQTNLKRPVAVTGAILYLALIGNVADRFVAGYWNEQLVKKRKIYFTAARVIKLAKSSSLPLLVTPGIAYPNSLDQNLPFHNTIPGDWVLKTHPAYEVRNSIPVYPIADMEAAEVVLDSLSIGRAVAFDGMSYRLVKLSE